ncbi:cupin domain-containing protein [Desulfobulbus rhabdoformis]|uniref:cupin domain-containing protein n=1 Tax=Desulfobulbus rhabdoformis TaxID=34032 RepID=UPI001963269F|nr:cupin domain-containing protein [Desulfobulbus rhabdoformis]MBM9613761.1 cupin domain-containing protein [Desulfobulbus rhabdoformis]
MREKEYFFEEGCFITELHNSLDDPQVSVARARVRPGETTRWHRLEGICERYLILEGIGQAEIGNASPQQVMPGETIHIPPGARQRITNTGTSDLIFLAVCTPRFVPEAYKDLEVD